MENPTYGEFHYQETFRDTTVLLDGKSFHYCVFENCELQFDGEAIFDLVDCQFKGSNPSFQSHAVTVIHQLKDLYADESTRSLAEIAILLIQKGGKGAISDDS